MLRSYLRHALMEVKEARDKLKISTYLKDAKKQVEGVVKKTEALMLEFEDFYRIGVC